MHTQITDDDVEQYVATDISPCHVDAPFLDSNRSYSIDPKIILEVV